MISRDESRRVATKESPDSVGQKDACRVYSAADEGVCRCHIPLHSLTQWYMQNVDESDNPASEGSPGKNGTTHSMPTTQPIR
jgi:hypothetical protein